MGPGLSTGPGRQRCGSPPGKDVTIAGSSMTLFEILGYPLFIVAALEVVLGVILLRHNPRNSAVIRSVAAFSLFSAGYALFTAIMYVQAGQGLNFTLPARLTWIGWFSIPAALQFIYFMKNEKSRAAGMIGLIFYPFWALVFGLCLFTDLVETGYASLIPYVDRPGPLENPLRLVGALMILWVMFGVYRLKTQVDGVRKRQLDHFFHGTLIFGGGGALTVGFLQLTGGLGFDPALGSYFSFPWVVLTFYAITRYRLFDIRLIISHTIGIALLFIIFSAVHIGMVAFFDPLLGASRAILLSLALIAVILLGTPFSARVQEGIQRLVVKGKHDYQQLLRESIKVIITKLELDELLRYLMSAMKDSLRPESARLFLRGADGRYTMRHGFGAHDKTAPQQLLDDGVVRWIERTARIAVREEMEGTLPEEEFRPLNTVLKNLGIEASVPLIYSGQLKGILTLGRKGGGESYLPSDIELLETLAGHAAVAIENARLYEEAGRVKESLRESEARFRNLVETSSDLIWEVDAGGAYTYVSPKIQDILGFDPPEVLGKTLFDFMPLEDARRAADVFRSMTESKKPFTVFQNAYVHKNGGLVVVESSGVPVFSRDGAFCGYRGIARDVTERKKLEDRLRYAQKMEAIGKLAAGVAHDFNNILTAIVGYGNVLQMKMPKDDPLRNNVDQILASTERAANLTHSLLTYGTKQAVTLGPVDMNDVIRKMEKLLEGLLPETVRLTIKPGEGPMNVMADRAQMERVFMNITANARDAMPDGGTITITTGRAELGAEYIKARRYGTVGAYAAVLITDTGIGMDETIRKKIFEPFFTTKSYSKGTGFGLSIVYGIVKQHNGYIDVESEPGRGTTFTVYIPVERPAPAEIERTPAVAAVLEGNETILVAEDEEPVRKLAKTVLEGFGYRVITAADGEEAVRLFSENRGRIQLLILDVIMPKMNGREAYRAIHEMQPGIKALFMSGYAEEIISKKGIIEPGLNFVLKPVPPKELVRKAREVLDA